MANYLDMLLGGAGGGLVPPGPPEPAPMLSQAPMVQAQPMVAPPQAPEQPLPSPIRPGPPSSPQEMQERQSGWSTLMQKMETDPTFAMSLMRLGTNLMQPVAPGQTPLGQTGLALQDAMNYLTFQQGQRRQAGLDIAESQRRERVVGTQERRGATEEEVAKSQIKTAEVARRGEEQQLQLNEKRYPLLLKKLEGEIKNQVSKGNLDDAQAEFITTKAKLYPVEVESELRRARAAETAAGRPTTFDMFELVARAGAKARGLQEGTPAFEQALNEERSRIGGMHFGGATVARGGALAQTLEVVKAANPIQQGEDPAAYNARVNKLALEHQKRAVQQDYQGQLMKFLTNPELMTMLPAPKDEKGKPRSPTMDDAKAWFDKIWEETHGEKPPTSGARGATPAPAAKPSAGQKAPTPAGVPPGGSQYPDAPPIGQRQPGPYNTPSGPMYWSGTGWRPLSGGR